MTPHLDEEALAALAFDAPVDQAHQAHLGSCPACQSRVDEARAMVSEVGLVLEVLEDPEPELSREKQAAIFRRLETNIAKESSPRWDRVVLPVVILVLSTLLIVVARERAELSSWVLVALLGAGLAGGLAHTPWAKFAALGTFALSIFLSVFDAEGMGTLSAVGVGKCMLAEVVVGAISASASIALLKRSASPPSYGTIAAALSAGALGAQGALLMTCHEPHGLVHGLVSHTLGLVVAASLTWPIARLPSLRAAVITED